MKARSGSTPSRQHRRAPDRRRADRLAFVAGHFGLAIILGLVALFLYWPAVVVAVAVLVPILAAVNGKKQFVVTYRPQAFGSTGGPPGP
jgi:Flp pilus assembly protein TadB